MIAMGGASFVRECNAVLCAQLHQAIFAAIAGGAMFATAYGLVDRRTWAAKVALLGTLPILVLHVVLVLSDPNESIFVPLSSAPVPASAAAVLVLQL